MTSHERSALRRLAVICVAWALGEALVRQLHATGLALVVPALLGVAAYAATRDTDLPGSGGDETYWRGQRIDRDRWH